MYRAQSRLQDAVVDMGVMKVSFPDTGNLEADSSPLNKIHMDSTMLGWCTISAQTVDRRVVRDDAVRMCGSVPSHEWTSPLH